MNKRKVLVLGAGGQVSQGIIKVLQYSLDDFEVLAACVSSEAPGLYFVSESYISPYANDESFIKWLISICNDKQIDIVISGVEEVIIEISKNLSRLSKYTSTYFVVDTIEKLLLCKNKLQTSQWLKQNNFCTPEYTSMLKKDLIHFTKSVEFPYILKPIYGKGSQGIKVINNFSELTTYIDNECYYLQQYVGNEDNEYTVATFTSKEGKCDHLIIMKRKLTNGTTTEIDIVENKKIEKESKRIVELLKPLGPCNLQFRLDINGDPYCFEINLRFSGTVSMRAHFGFNDVAATIRHYVDNGPIELQCTTKGKALRYWEELFID